MAGPAVGIDLGTLNSCAAVVKDGKAVVLADESRNTVPSCVAIHQGRELVGAAAKRHAVTSPQSTIIAVKRLIGHPFDSDEVRAASSRVPYTLAQSPLGGVLLEVEGVELTPVQVSAKILQRVREVAEKALGEPVKQAVISVPAHFNDVQRKATKLAAEYAGLEVLRLINEPTAAAFAYGYKKHKDFTLAVYDLGGGTFDVTVMRARGDTFEVVATDGDSYLGGEDFDYAIAEWLEREFEAEHGSDLSRDPAARLRLKEAGEKAKIELADAEVARIDLPFLARLADGTQVNFSRTLSREKLAELCAPLVTRTLELCERCLSTARISRGEIGEVLLVGGQSRMLAVRDAVKNVLRQGSAPRHQPRRGGCGRRGALRVLDHGRLAAAGGRRRRRGRLRGRASSDRGRAQDRARGRAAARQAARRQRAGGAAADAAPGHRGRRRSAAGVRRAGSEHARPDHVRRDASRGGRLAVDARPDPHARPPAPRSRWRPARLGARSRASRRGRSRSRRRR